MTYKILIVDDEPDVIAPMASRLIREGFAVVSASDGNQALAKVAQDNPDILLLDLTMPGKNGFEVLTELRANHADRWRPVIIVTARQELETARQCYQLDADHYLTKPCTLDQVVKAVRTMISLIPQRVEGNYGRV